ncbi:deuterosome assembly protein 1 isoform X2 [Zonotrichia albicollis]|uniref:deuterosome assembly protein 1 isoform X2 n=1 Tax=Zonotrichia albicollis TaxID=44394 RepID=UPI003D811854
MGAVSPGRPHPATPRPSGPVPSPGPAPALSRPCPGPVPPAFPPRPPLSRLPRRRAGAAAGRARGWPGCGTRTAATAGAAGAEGGARQVKTTISGMEEDLEVFQEQAVTKASPCEAELQELVHQIDIMVNRKQVEWERKMRALEAKMDIQDQELASAQSKLDQKGQEVGLLQQELENLQKTKNEMAQSYETQLQALKSQFSKLIHSYEKLQSYQLKQEKLESREKCEENLETSSNPRNLYVKLEGFKAKSQEWEKNGTTCVNSPVYGDMQQKLLPEKCNLFQRQSQNYQLQICNKKQDQEELITYTQPKSENHDLIIEKLKAIVNEIARNKNKLVEENMKLREDLKIYQNQCQNMEADISDMRNELHSRDGLWRRIQLECQKLYTELLKIKEYKDIQEIQIKYGGHQSSHVQLTEQLENKNPELLLFAESHECQEEELNKIRNHVYREEQSHCSEQERMKTEISDLTEELHQKEITIATIMEKATLLERQLKMELETKHKLLTKQQLLEFHYQVIKSENTHLKEMMENQECESCMYSALHTVWTNPAGQPGLVTRTESTGLMWLYSLLLKLKCIDLCSKEHGNFTASVHKMKHENLRLQNSLVKPQNDTGTCILSCMDACRETEHSCQTHSKMQEKEERSFQNKDSWEVECQQTAVLTAGGYHRHCTPALCGHCNITGSKSDSTLSSHPLHRGHEKKIDSKSPLPPVGYPLGLPGPFPEVARTGSFQSPAYNAEEIKLSSPPEMSFLATAEKFLQEEEKHAREFEERLNSHLEELQRYSENTLKKYARMQQSRRT